MVSENLVFFTALISLLFVIIAVITSLVAIFNPGTRGKQGNVGITGPTGSSKGPTGSPGPIGVSGATGQRGDTGMQGIQLNPYKFYKIVPYQFTMPIEDLRVDFESGALATISSDFVSSGQIANINLTATFPFKEGDTFSIISLQQVIQIGRESTSGFSFTINGSTGMFALNPGFVLRLTLEQTGANFWNAITSQSL